MKTYTVEEMKAILADHAKWLRGEGGARADLSSANLRSANLRSADLRSANLRSANLRSANLSSADLRYADLSSANLSSADLSYANLRSADLSSANLSSANLSHADLRSADLSSADLSSADLRSADLRSAKPDEKTIWPHFQICSGGLIVWKKVQGRLVTLLIPGEAKRTASLVGRKCRAEYAVVTWIEGDQPVTSSHNGPQTTYEVGKTIYPDSYDDNPMVECSHGIHFFQTRKEAEEF